MSNLDTILEQSKEEAQRLKADYVDSSHVLLAIINGQESLAVKVLMSQKIDLQSLKMKTELVSENSINLEFKGKKEKLIKQAQVEANEFCSESINSEHFLLAILKDRGCKGWIALKYHSIEYDLVASQLVQVILNEVRRNELKSKENQEYECSFCGKLESDVSRLVAGPDVFICNECVELCNAILIDDEDNG